MFFLKEFKQHVYKYLFLSGSILAIVISWEDNWSILWALLHGTLGWIYVFYAKDMWFLFSVAIAFVLLGLYKLYEAYGVLNKLTDSLENGLNK